MTRRFLRDLHLLVAASATVGLANFAGESAAHAQPSVASAPGPKFALASVKVADPSSTPFSLEYRPEAGKFTANASSLERLIGFAYDVRNHQISGGPKWRDSAVFNIEAKAESAIPPGPDGTHIFRLMLQSLLAERFRLAVHHETHQEQVYELVIDKGGSKLRERTGPGGGLRMALGQLTGVAVPLFLLVNQLSRQLGHTVIDKTGLTGKYDFTVKWEPDSGAFGPDAPVAPDSSGPSIFTAVREDLGLRLQSAKGPVEIIVIDHVEKPDAN